MFKIIMEFVCEKCKKIAGKKESGSRSKPSFQGCKNLRFFDDGIKKYWQFFLFTLWFASHLCRSI